MTARRLEPAGAYQGPIWGTLPGAFPTEQAERVYRYLLEQMPSDSIPRDLMGYGFQGVAYRFRAASDYGAEFEGLIGAPGARHHHPMTSIARSVRYSAFLSLALPVWSVSPSLSTRSELTTSRRSSVCLPVNCRLSNQLWLPTSYNRRGRVPAFPM